jgi:hypothetical protein
MEFEFDKEIDSLLRQTARKGEAVFNGKSSLFAASESLHVDADEISLFAENALPVKARSRVTNHLADCDRCRKILSGLIALDSETESENVHAKEIAGAAASLPWYKKLFAFPQIAYAMGALALVFSGVIALVVLQNTGGSLNTGMAQKESAPASRDAAKNESVDAAAAPETYAMSNTSTMATGNANSTANTMMAANTAANSPVKPTPPILAATNSNTALAAREQKPAAQPQAGGAKDTKPETLGELAMAKPVAPGKKEDAAKSGPPIRTDDDLRVDKKEVTAAAKQPAEIAQSPSVVQNQVGILRNSQRARQPAPAPRPEAEKSVAAESMEKAETKKGKSPEMRTAGGKTFRRADGVWYDTAYKGGKTTNIRRGTSEYKKLDSGLRSIAENIGGTVVVVWKDKAYRIQ